MKITTIQSLLVMVFCAITFQGFAQTLTIDADLRARFEYRHGFNTLFPDDADPAAFVQQRTRLNIGYEAEKLELFIAVQDVSTWGDTRQILDIDGNDSFMLFQAYAKLNFNENWSTKLGRQSIAYDNERILGGLDWAMQGRFHDALLVMYRKGSFMADVGGAFSQERPSNLGTEYTIEGFFTYKSMQYLYARKAWDKTSVSFLFLNTGFQDFTGENNDIPDGVSYRQTTGSYFSFPISDFTISGSAYYQFGKSNADTDLSAYEVSLEGSYTLNKTTLGLGFEMLSGTDQEGSSKNNSFLPMYGTNHKFNGYMDYFYVGNHANNVGLNDIWAKAKFITGEKNNLLIKGHYFLANADLVNDADKYLGTEVDLVFNQELMKFVSLGVGYSHMFASESMSLIKDGTTHDNTNNWAWVQLIVDPTLFTTNFKKE